MHHHVERLAAKQFTKCAERQRAAQQELQAAQDELEATSRQIGVVESLVTRAARLREEARRERARSDFENVLSPDEWSKDAARREGEAVKLEQEARSLAKVSGIDLLETLRLVRRRDQELAHCYDAAAAALGLPTLA